MLRMKHTAKERLPIVYLDNCAIQRPLDVRNQLRIAAEADAIITVLESVLSRKIELVTSATLRAESALARFPHRKRFAQYVLNLATKEGPSQVDMRLHVRDYIHQGIKMFDALHLASAVVVQADYFCTTDDKLLRRARKVNTEATHVVTPAELVQYLHL